MGSHDREDAPASSRVFYTRSRLLALTRLTIPDDVFGPVVSDARLREVRRQAVYVMRDEGPDAASYFLGYIRGRADERAARRDKKGA